jgi:hypothetical protein
MDEVVAFVEPHHSLNHPPDEPQELIPRLPRHRYVISVSGGQMVELIATFIFHPAKTDVGHRPLAGQEAVGDGARQGGE